jgi:VIT1/CCC1 family predicted Fe2+/Mn2+ transporter
MPASAQQLANLQKERDGAYLYGVLAEIEPDPQVAEVFRRMAATETRHAATWAASLAAAGITVPAHKPAWRTRVLAALARRFGVAFVLPSIVGAEQADSGAYAAQGDVAAPMAADEKYHARLLRELTADSTTGMGGDSLARIEGRHRAVGGNALRAAVLGANDGLVSNLSLVMGVAGFELAGRGILVTGMAGLLAGAISMALGEWLSVQSSRELHLSQLAIEQAEIAATPAEEAEELALIYQARGLPEEEARRLAGRIMADEAGALDVLAREELGIDPRELGGSAWEAAITSFVLFALGAIIPVAPFFFLSGTAAVATSLAASAVGLFAIGAGITLFTGRSVLFSGSRQVLFGLAAAAITFGIGRLFGANLGG